jgi:hypothetical protein
VRSGISTSPRESTPTSPEALARGALELLRDGGARVIFHTEDAHLPEREPWESLGFEADVVRFSLYDD